jgi:hypothetical protein
MASMFETHSSCPSGLPPTGIVNVFRICQAAYCILAITLASLTGGCETVVDVDVPQANPRLVAQGFFTADSLWAVRIHESAPFTSPAAPRLIENAVVEITGSGEAPLQLIRTDSGIYTGRGFVPRAGQRYSLHAAAPGLPPTTGADVLPAAPAIVGYAAVLSARDVGIRSSRHVVEVKMTLEDPPNEPNRYGLLVIQARLSENKVSNQWRLLPPSLFLFESDNPAFGQPDFGFLDMEKEQYLAAFFTDETFDGQTYGLDFSFQYDLAGPDADLVTHRAFGIVVLSVSEHFYSYWKTAVRQAFTNENPFAEPLQVHSNMSAGPGIFAGFQFQVYPAALDTFDLERACAQSVELQMLCASLNSPQLPADVLSRSIR